MSKPDLNVGHGRVFKRPDGESADCGGPGVCSECAFDLARVRQIRDELREQALDRTLDPLAAHQAVSAQNNALDMLADINIELPLEWLRDLLTADDLQALFARNAFVQAKYDALEQKLNTVRREHARYLALLRVQD